MRRQVEAASTQAAATLARAAAAIIFAALGTVACSGASAPDEPAEALGTPPSATLAADEASPIITASVELSFVEGADDALTIEHACTGEPLMSFAATEGGFVRGLVPMLEQERRIRRLALDEPYTLSRDTRGRLYLLDPAAGTRVDLEAFGTDAVQVFDSFLPVSPTAGPAS